MLIATSRFTPYATREAVRKARHQDIERIGAVEMIESFNLAAAFARFDDRWSPKIVGEVNDAHVKLVKLHGDFVWHHHEHEDELFFVVRGRLTMKLRDGVVVVDPGEFVIVPHGVEHCPCAADECWVMLIEPKSTLNTGNLVNERTVADLERL